MTVRDDVVEILRASILEERGEGRAPLQHLPDVAVENASAESLGAFRIVFEALSAQVPESHYRTRYTHKIAPRGYGIMFCTRPANETRLRHIQCVMLPTRARFNGQLEAYVYGHRDSPLTAAPAEVIPRRNDTVFRYVERPTATLVSELIRAFQSSALFDMIEHD